MLTFYAKCLSNKGAHFSYSPLKDMLLILQCMQIRACSTLQYMICNVTII